VNARATALAALAKWRSGSGFADAIIQQLLSRSSLGAADRGFATELFYGVLRNLTLLDFWIAQLRSGSVDRESRDVLRLGLYQLFCLGTPSHAAVFETVELAHRRSRSLVNAILRNATRRAAELTQRVEQQPLSTRKSHPDFLLERWEKTFGAEATEQLCDWNNQPAPVYARTRELDFVKLESIPDDALRRGEIYIQDPSTAAACRLLDPQPGERVLDACAAPGGKTTFLAQLMKNQGEIIACDRDAARLQIVRENAQRMGTTIVQTLQHDWTQPAAELQLFDRILLDAPCTNTGVMRRRVDVRWRLQPEDFPRMQQLQLTIAAAVIPLLKPGGTFVYSTCSIEPDENEAVAEQLPLRLIDTKQVLPFRDGYDGAFAAKFQRV
jgi:16S rRNA (cytosine967-C5)-methyltransferase